MENCVAPGLDEFNVLLEVVLSLVRVLLLTRIVMSNPRITEILQFKGW